MLITASVYLCTKRLLSRYARAVLSWYANRMRVAKSKLYFLTWRKDRSCNNRPEWMNRLIFCENTMAMPSWHHVTKRCKWPKASQPLSMLMLSYLPQSAKLHDDPHRVFCDNSNQLNNIRMVKLTHCHCETNVDALRRWLNSKCHCEKLAYRLLVGTFLWRCLKCSFCRS